MSQIVAGNPRILQQINFARSVLNGHCSFRLFTNDIGLSPSTPVSWLVEPTFAGYTRLDTVGKFGLATKVFDGRYQTESSPFVVTVAADSEELVYGWSISVGPSLFYAAKFDQPIPALAGFVYSIVVALQESALSLCSC